METSKQINCTDRANSFSGRWGKVGTDFKIYYDELIQLKSGIDSVIEGAKYLKERMIELELEDGTAKDSN